MDSLLKGNLVSGGGVSCGQIPQDGLVASYLLQGTAEDETGTYDGTETSMSYAYDDERGIVSSHNGIASKIDSTYTPNNLVSVSFWFKASSIGTNQGLLACNNGAANGGGFGIDLFSSQLRLSVSGVSNWVLTTNIGSTLLSDTLYNVVFILDNTIVYVYLDDVLIYTSGTLAPKAATIPFVFGYSANQGYMTGNLSNLHIYNRALTATEVTDIYNIEKYQHNNALDEGLIAYYPLDGNSLDNAINQRDGTDTSMTYPSDADMGVVADFVSTNSSKIVSSAIVPNTDFTFSCLFKTPNMIGRIMDASTGTWAGALEILGSSGVIKVRRGNSASSQTDVLTSATNVADNTWRHLCITGTGDNYVLYYDGVVDTSNTATQNIAVGDTFVIGCRDGSIYDAFFDGQISNIRLYNRALSAKEIDWLYDYEKPNSTECIENSTIDNPDPFGDGSGIALYKLDGNANDATGDYDGTASNVTYSGGEFGQCGVFNGSSSRIATSTIPTRTTGTISIWFNIASTPTDTCFAVFYTGVSNENSIQFNPTYGIGFFPYNTTSGAGFTHITTLADSTQYFDGAWHNLVISFDGNIANTIIAVDNTSYPITVGNSYTTTMQIEGSLILAERGNSAFWLNGSLEQVRIFNKSLSADERTILYNERKV